MRSFASGPVGFLFLLATLCLCLGWVRPAHAQSEPFARGIDPVHNRLSPSMNSYLTLSSAELAVARSYQLDLWLDYSRGLMAFQIGDEKVGNLIHDRLDLHLHGAYALVDWLELAVDLPVTVYQANGFDALEAETGFAAARPAQGGLGDVKLQARAGILDEARFPVGLAAIVEGRGLTGDGDSFLGERTAMISPRLAVEKHLTPDFRVSLEGGYRYRPDPGQYLNLYVGDEIVAGLGGSHALPEMGALTHAVLLEVFAATPARAPFTQESSDALKTPLEALVGWRGVLSEQWHFTVGGGRGLALIPGYGREELRLFASIRFRGKVEERANNDRDGDGVPDDEDRCPDDPGPPELDGCPDRDGDGIPDVDDRCPDEPGVPKADGCKPKEVVVYEDGKIILFGAITFDSGKDTIKEESLPVVDEVAKVLEAHPNIKKVRVDGHTDSVGADAMNLELSRRRALAVKERLIQQGIAPERLDSEGFGETQPIESNATALGRAKNRRVEFTTLEIAE
jgi:OmpA-OmpF porin, OOP family